MGRPFRETLLNLYGSKQIIHLVRLKVTPPRCMWSNLPAWQSLQQLLVQGMSHEATMTWYTQEGAYHLRWTCPGGRSTYNASPDPHYNNKRHGRYRHVRLRLVAHNLTSSNIAVSTQIRALSVVLSVSNLLDQIKDLLTAPSVQSYC